MDDSNPYVMMPPPLAELTPTQTLRAIEAQYRVDPSINLQYAGEQPLVMQDQTDTGGLLSSDAQMPVQPVFTSGQQAFTQPQPTQQQSIVYGMFPEVDAMQRALYAQEQQRAMQAQALQYARLSPMEQAQYGLYLGGQQLGGAIGGALGAQDPQLQRISMRNAIMRELDPSNPSQMLQVAQKYAQADPEFAMQIANNARKAAVQIQQANKERQLAVPADLQKAQMVSQLEDALDQYKVMPASSERDRAMKLVESQLKVLKATKETAPAAPLQVATRLAEIVKAQSLLDPASTDYKLLEVEKTQLQRSEKPEPRPSVGGDREAFALEEFNQTYYDITPEQRAKVNARADAEATKKAQASAPKVQVDLKDPTATAKASLDVMGKWEGFLKSGGDVEVANRYKAVKSAVAMAATNPSADGALLYNIAKMYDPSGAVQEGDKKSITGNPSIPSKFKLLVQGVLEGGSFTPQQRQDLLNIANEIVKNKQSQLNLYRKQYIKKNKVLGGDEMDILDPYQGLLPLDAFVR